MLCWSDPSETISPKVDESTDLVCHTIRPVSEVLRSKVFDDVVRCLLARDPRTAYVSEEVAPFLHFPFLAFSVCLLFDPFDDTIGEDCVPRTFRRCRTTANPIHTSRATITTGIKTMANIVGDAFPDADEKDSSHEVERAEVGGKYSKS